MSVYGCEWVCDFAVAPSLAGLILFLGSEIDKMRPPDDGYVVYI